MGEAMLPSRATMLRSGARVRGMAGPGPGRWLALDIRLNRDNTERFHGFQTLQLLFPGAARKAGWLGCSACACVCASALCACVCVCVLRLSQGHEVHGLQERQGKEQQQQPRGVLDQEAEAGAFLQFVCEEKERGGREERR